MGEPAEHFDVEPDGDDLPDTSASWPHWAPGVIEAMKTRPSLTQAAQVVGVARTTVQRLQQRDPFFKRSMSEARDEALDTLEEVCRIRATTGQVMASTKTVTVEKIKPDQTKETTTTTETTESRHVSDNLLMFYLKRWRPEYRDSYRVETTGKDGGPIVIEEKLRDVDDRFAAGVLRLVDGGAAGDAAS